MPKHLINMLLRAVQERTRHCGPSAERSTLASRVGCPRALHSIWKRRSFSRDTASALSSWYLRSQSG